MRRSIRGFTILELIITIGISSFLGLVAYNFSRNGFDAWRISNARAQTQEQVRRAIDTMTDTLRNARTADNGSFALESVQANSITLYANTDTDPSIEQVKFSLTGTSLVKQVIKPSGAPSVYLVASAVSSTVVTNVRVLTFDYFDKNYTGTGSPLVQPVSPNDVRLVRITVTVDDDPTKAPDAVTLSTFVNFRNLKDNL